MRVASSSRSSPFWVIAGTTASGKSALALALAERIGGVIVNADSVQLYKDLALLTARPDAADMARVPHRLYGILEADEPTTAASWLALVAPVLDELRQQERPAILTGGTGLYIHALLHGLAPVPPIDEAIRAEVRALAPAALHPHLVIEDPAMAARLEPGDQQRLMRALEVVRATGTSLLAWQQRRSPPLVAPDGTSGDVRGLVLLPPRDVLRRRIRARMAAMIEAGALDEVRALRARHAEPLALPLAKAHGLLELFELLEGRCTEDEAIERTAIRVGQYAKRQSTWFRHQLPELQVVTALGETSEALAYLLA